MRLWQLAVHQNSQKLFLSSEMLEVPIRKLCYLE